MCFFLFCFGKHKKLIVNKAKRFVNNSKKERFFWIESVNLIFIVYLFRFLQTLKNANKLVLIILIIQTLKKGGLHVI